MTIHKNSGPSFENDFQLNRQRQMPEGKTCDWPGCEETGEHRAPKSRDELGSFYWFCRLHAREYNAKWNYYEGMSDDEVDADVRRDTTWQRPSWPLGTNTSSPFRDPLNILEDREEVSPNGPFPPGSPEAKALDKLELKWPVTQESVKACYKKLVKRHHPDANAGSKEAEEEFKQVKEAYEILMLRLAEMETGV